jgi:hypothetical protein
MEAWQAAASEARAAQLGRKAVILAPLQVPEEFEEDEDTWQPTAADCAKIRVAYPKEADTANSTRWQRR